LIIEKNALDKSCLKEDTRFRKTCRRGRRFQEILKATNFLNES